MREAHFASQSRGFSRMPVSREFRTVYKSLLRIARDFDAHPAARCLIFRVPPTLNENIIKSPSSVYYSQVLEDFMPSANFHFGRGHKTLTEIVRAEARVDYPRWTIMLDDRMNCAYHTIRKLSTIWNCYESHRRKDGERSDNLSKSIQTIASYHTSDEKLSSTISTSIGPGVLLVSHPLAAKHYKRSLILLLQHDEDGSYGELTSTFPPILV